MSFEFYTKKKGFQKKHGDLNLDLVLQHNGVQQYCTGIKILDSTKNANIANVATDNNKK